MSIELDDLKPYASLLIARVRSGTNKLSVLDQALNDVEVFVANSSGRTLGERLSNTDSGPLRVGFLTYTQERTPGWTTSDEIIDRLNHLVFVGRRDRHLAFCSSDAAALRWMSGHMNGSDTNGLAGLERIPASLLNTAFGKGATRTLWLSGIHTRTSSKPDAKVLAGSNLRDALDPVSDQSYHFTSARTQPAIAGAAARSVGFTPRSSKVWAGSVREYAELRDLVYALLGEVKDSEQIGGTSVPFDVLATPVDSVTALIDPYDLSVVAPELLAGDPIEDPEEEQLAERWAHRASFTVTPTGPGTMTVDVEVDDHSVGSIDLDLTVGADGAVSTEVTVPPTANEDLEEAAVVVRKPAWLTIRFESGHTLSNGVVYSVRHRDLPFESWEFVDLTGFDVKKEKPPTSSSFDPARIGLDDSLFCWVKNKWPLDQPGRGWLTCDDGAGEIADFVHFDIAHPGGPLLSLIHVKASGSASPARQISTSDYEVVGGQAVKNLRNLDRINLADGLQAGHGNSVSVATWADGVQQTRIEMANALRGVGEHYRRHLVILQPRVTQTELGLARAAIADGTTTGRAARMRQLDTLLLEAESAARDLGATFSVVGDQI